MLYGFLFVAWAKICSGRKNGHLLFETAYDILSLLHNSRANARKLTPRGIQKRGVMRMTSMELFMALIAVASLCLTIYFGMKR